MEDKRMNEYNRGQEELCQVPGIDAETAAARYGQGIDLDKLAAMSAGEILEALKEAGIEKESRTCSPGR